MRMARAEVSRPSASRPFGSHKAIGRLLKSLPRQALQQGARHIPRLRNMRCASRSESRAQITSPSRMASLTRRRFASATASVSRCRNRLRLRDTRRAPEPSISRSARKPSYLRSKSQAGLSNAAARCFSVSGAHLHRQFRTCLRAAIVAREW
jgi:hypothetical protein